MLSKGCGFSGWNETKWTFPEWNVLFPYRKPWWWAKSCNLAEEEPLNLTKIWQDCGKDWTHRAHGQPLHWQCCLITSKVSSLCNSWIHQSQTNKQSRNERRPLWLCSTRIRRKVLSLWVTSGARVTLNSCSYQINLFNSSDAVQLTSFDLSACKP